MRPCPTPSCDLLKSHKSHPQMLEHPHFRKQLSANPEGALYYFLVGNHSLRLGGAECHSRHFTLSCKSFQCSLKVMLRQSQQKHSISKKHGCYFKAQTRLKHTHSSTCLCFEILSGDIKTGLATRDKPYKKTRIRATGHSSSF